MVDLLPVIYLCMYVFVCRERWMQLQQLSRRRYDQVRVHTLALIVSVMERFIHSLLLCFYCK